MEHLHDYLKFGVSKGASDIHFSSEEVVRYRIDGDLIPLESAPLTPEVLQALIFEILTDSERVKLLDEKNLDKSYYVPGVGQFRVNVFFNRKGIAAVLRSIPVKVPSFESLGLPEIIRKVAERPRGLILVTGPTGSGKSTTLAAVIDYLNSNYPYHILTVEDPIEFIHESKMSLVNQRDIGKSCHTFQDALKYALREDPDVILVGELRDLETISLALTAAETGHLVLGTLHTRGAAASVDRMIDSFPAGQQAMIRAMIADSLLAVVSQVLCKRITGQGRIAAYEIMVVNNAISNLIREGKLVQIEGVIQTGRKDGMVLLEQSLATLVTQGLIAKEEAIPYLKNVSADSLPGGAPAQKNMAPVSLVSSKMQIKSAPPIPQTPPPAMKMNQKESPIDSLLDNSEPDSEDESLMFAPIDLEQTNVKNVPPQQPQAPPPLKKKAG